MKKLLALMLACLMIVGLFAGSAMAESEKEDTIVIMAPPLPAITWKI